MAEPGDSPMNCANCGATVLPFGELRHVFVVDGFGPICSDCARKLVPDKVSHAEDMEQRLSRFSGSEESGE